MKNYGSISKRDNGLIMGRVMYKGIRKTFYGHSSAAVQEKMNDFVMTAKYSNLTEKKVTKFGNYALQYLFTYKFNVVKASSYDRLESICEKHLCGSDVDVELYKLSDGMLQSFLNEKSLEYSKSTTKKIYDLLRMVLFYAYRKKDIDVDLASFLVIPKTVRQPKRIQIYTNDEMSALVDSIEEKVQSKDYKYQRLYRYAFAYLIIYNTGLRAGELLSLKKESIDLERRLIHVSTTLSHVKSRKESGTIYMDVVTSVKTDNSIRDIPINDKCLKYITYLMCDGIVSDYLIHNLEGDVLKLRSFQQTFWRICADSGIENKGLHALRHTFASTLIYKGVSPNVVSRLLGHSSVKFTFDRYVHPHDDEYENALSLLNDKF